MEECVCNDGYVFEDNACKIDCSSLLESVRQGEECVCNDGYVFEDNLCKIDCSSVTESTGVRQGEVYMALYIYVLYILYIKVPLDIYIYI